MANIFEEGLMRSSTVVHPTRNLFRRARVGSKVHSKNAKACPLVITQGWTLLYPVLGYGLK